MVVEKDKAKDETGELEEEREESKIKEVGEFELGISGEVGREGRVVLDKEREE